MNRIVRIGSRKSRLALVQSNLVKNMIDATPGYSSEIITMDTKGDIMLDRSLPAIGDKGLFTRELEEQLLEGRIDIAVHSLKDLPTSVPAGLMLGAITRREDARDVFLSTRFGSFHSLPRNARIATGSLRRRAQLLHMRSDLTIEDLRGNVPTRIDKLTRNDYDGIILAAAGVKRLGLADSISSFFDIDEMIPAAGQGALGIETREDASDLQPLLERLHNTVTACETSTERSILHRLDGSCQVPIGVSVTVDGSNARIAAFVANPDGSRFLVERREGGVASIDSLSDQIVSSLLAQGAAEIIRALKNSPGA